MELPQVQLPRPVPVPRVRPPQENIPPTPQQRERIRDLARAFVAEKRPVPPLSLDELRGLTEEFILRHDVSPKLRRLRRRASEQRDVARPVGGGALSPAAVVVAQMPADRGPLPGAVRRVRPALQAVRPLFDPGTPGRGRAARLCRAGCRRFGHRDGHPPDRQDRRHRRRELPFRAGEGIPLRRVRSHPGRCHSAAAKRLQGRYGRSRLDLGSHPLDQRRPDLSAQPRPASASRSPSGSRQLRWTTCSGPLRAKRSASPGNGWRRRQALAAVPGGMRLAGAMQEEPRRRLPVDLRRLAVAVECFHKASLIHDDIEDNDSLRYGEPTLHVSHGVPFALNVGDFLLGEGYRLIGQCEAPAENRVAMLQAAAAGTPGALPGARRRTGLELGRRSRCARPKCWKSFGRRRRLRSKWPSAWERPTRERMPELGDVIGRYSDGTGHRLPDPRRPGGHRGRNRRFRRRCGPRCRWRS